MKDSGKIWLIIVPQKFYQPSSKDQYRFTKQKCYENKTKIQQQKKMRITFLKEKKDTECCFHYQMIEWKDAWKQQFSKQRFEKGGLCDMQNIPCIKESCVEAIMLFIQTKQHTEDFKGLI